jgi:putative spermidine/putrescine transport system ATP-binding protein
VDLDIRQGEFFSMLGRRVREDHLPPRSGFETPSEGRILLHGVDVTRSPYDRDINTVFQDYAGT